MIDGVFITWFDDGIPDLCVHHRPGSASIGGRPISLTALEWKLLTLFAHNHGKVVTKEEMAKEAGLGLNQGYENWARVYVHQLRRKLEAGGEPRLIHTVRFQGYILTDHPDIPF